MVLQGLPDCSRVAEEEAVSGWFSGFSLFGVGFWDWNLEPKKHCHFQSLLWWGEASVRLRGWDHLQEEERKGRCLTPGGLGNQRGWDFLDLEVGSGCESWPCGTSCPWTAPLPTELSLCRRCIPVPSADGVKIPRIPSSSWGFPVSLSC